jgi:hypothetical protein
VCTRAPCGRCCVLELSALALSMLAALPAVVSELASQARMLRTQQLFMSAARPDWSGLAKLCLLRVVPCARCPCATRCSALVSELELPTLAALTAVVLAGVSGPDAQDPDPRTRSLCGPLRRGALLAGAPHAGSTYSCGHASDVSGPDAPIPDQLLIDWSRLAKLCLLRVVPCARGPCAARRGVLELSTLRSPRLLRPQRWSSTRRLGLGCSGPGAPTFMWAARPDWTLLTKLCFLRAVPCA